MLNQNDRATGHIYLYIIYLAPQFNQSEEVQSGCAAVWATCVPYCLPVVLHKNEFLIAGQGLATINLGSSVYTRCTGFLFLQFIYIMLKTAMNIVSIHTP